MSTLATLHSLAIALAGPDFQWSHPNAPTQMNSKHKQGLSLLMREYQLGLCVACGEELGDEVTNYCHIVAARGCADRGRMGGNGYIGHVSCNDIDAKVYGDIVPLGSLIRPDLIMLAFPTRTDCLAALVKGMGTVTSASVKANRAANREANLKR